jgi:citronellyl-CoA dehydrogenase
MTTTSPTPELSIEELRAEVRAFVREDIDPHADAWEEAQLFPAHELFAKAGKRGLLGLTKDPAYGGLGLDIRYSVAMAEELGRCRSAGVAMALGVQTDMCTPALNNFGNDALREKYLAGAISGELVGCVGVSEVEAGSDVASIRTTAIADGDEYVINGGKMWITNGMQADFMVCLCNTEVGPGVNPHHNKSLIVIPLDAPGVERSRKLHKLGMWASDTAQLFFDGVRVPKDNLIGAEGAGFMLQMLQFQDERLWGAANVVGSLDLLISQTIEQTRLRQAFGKPILHNQVVHHRLAELSTEVEALRSLVSRAADLVAAERAAGEVPGSEMGVRLASMAKLKAGRLCREVSDACLQYWGGMGFMWESPVARMFRDGRLVSIGGGADEVMLNIICKIDGTLPGRKEELHLLAEALGYDLVRRRPKA